MVFNILSNNTDDHNKNFSFVMNEDGSWRLAPAYDITYIIDRGGSVSYTHLGGWFVSHDALGKGELVIATSDK